MDSEQHEMEKEEGMAWRGPCLPLMSWQGKGGRSAESCHPGLGSQRKAQYCLQIHAKATTRGWVRDGLETTLL